MGKLKKPASANKDDGQKKISNFFQQSTAKPKPKSLFSEHGPQTCKPKFQSVETILIQDDTDDFKAVQKFKSNVKADAAKEMLSSSKKINEASVTNKKEKAPLVSEFSSVSNSTVSNSAVTCIPETQGIFTPPGLKNSKASTCEANDVNDFGLIPDTPEGKKDEEVKAKRPLGRSFLLSTAQMGSNPIQKAKENREAKLTLKRKLTQARKGLLSVSVQFNPEENVHSKDSSRQEANDQLETIERTNDESSSKGFPQTDKLLEESITPTKIYSGGNSLKRMSKSGTSPDSKRTVNDSAEQDLDSVETSQGWDVGSIAVKKQLSFPLIADGCDSANGKKVVKNSEKTGMGELDVDIGNESFQSAKSLLGNQFAMVSKEQKLKMEKKKRKEKEQKLKQQAEFVEKQRVAKEENRRKSEKLMKYQLTGFTDNEDKYEGNVSVMEDGALDDILQELTSPSLIKKSKPMAVASKKSKVPDFTRTKPFTAKSSDTMVNSRHAGSMNKEHVSSAFKDKENKISANDWTKADDEYFAKLGVKTGTNTKDVKKQNNKDDEAVEIEHYLTQCNPKTERSRSPTSEIEIEEFITQKADSKFLCDKMEGLSPFKRNRDSVHVDEAPCAAYSRYTVNKVDQSSSKHEMILEVCSQPGDVRRKCILSGFWLDSHIQEGDTVNILAEFTDNVCHITDQSGLLVVNPDLLLSGTTVVSSVFCMRKSILKEKFKGCDSRNIQMLYGSIIHSIFQQMLKKRLCTAEAIIKEASSIVKQLSNLQEMYANKATEDKVMEEVKSYIPQMISWYDQSTRLGNVKVKRDSASEVVVTNICDIEENMWSPRYGVKGKIDLTVEVKLRNEPGATVMPLELKTGKTSFSVEHKGQVTLYSMMCGDRRKDPQKGLLLYLKESNMKVIPADHIHKKGLIQLRNEMAYYISRQVIRAKEDSGEKSFTLGRLPDPISNIRACQKCPQLINCSIYQRQVEGRSGDSSSMSGLVNETLGHLTSDHLSYFIQWCLMLDLETQLGQSKKTLADIWCKSSRQREADGLCLGGMFLQSDSCEDIGEDTVILKFSRQHPLRSIGIIIQDSVVISRENPAWVAVCTGFVHHIFPSSIAVLTERESFDRLLGMRDGVFRIDKCDSFSTAGILYTNVSRLMADEPHSQKLRRLIIDRVRPEFTNTLSKGNIEKVKNIFKSLNKPQKTAILKVLMSKSYVLIRGYPGTGKTSTIVALVKVLYELGLSVLLTSYTHSAVDNILLKLKKDDVKFLRIGRVAKVHSDVRKFTMEAMAKGISSTAELDNFFTSQKIVATSCLGINHPVFTQRQFDVCIVDEASQVLQPACLGPLFTAKKFVLVGDPKQLPPVVQSKDSRELGMDESLFCRLDGLGATFDLNVQYRMNKEIMAISNTLVYNGCLKCGSEAVAGQTLVIKKSEATQEVREHLPWIDSIIDENLCKSVIVLDTQRLGANHVQLKTGGYRNEMEASIVEKIIISLCKAGVSSNDIGVIAPYRSQVLHIRDTLAQGHMMLTQGHMTSEVEVNTVDQYQGRDKDVIIISFVMSSNEKTGKVGELLQDIRRLNVAMTRAKKKLILVGNTATLCQYTHLKQLLDLLDSSNITVLEKFQIV